MIDYDKIYSDEGLYWGTEPSKILIKALKHIEKGDVLDLGTGEGREAVFLAKKGFNVKAIDSSARGIHKLNQLCKIHNISVNYRVGDIAKEDYEEDYDIIVCNYVLHFLSREYINKVIEKMKRHTKKNGINVISVFTEDNDYKGFSYLFRKGELKDHYGGWEILEYNEYITPMEQHGNTKPHRHAVAEIIARKPSF